MGLAGRLTAVLRRDRLIYLFVATTTFVVYWLSHAYGVENRLGLLSYLKSFLSMLGFFIVCASAAYFFHLASNRHPRPLLAFWLKLKSILSQPAEIAAFIILMVTFSIAFSCFTSLKSMIPVIVPYQYDALFAEVDKAMHLGVHPWVISHAVFNHPIATSIINFFYNIWFFVSWSVLIFFMLRIRSPRLRNTFLLSFLLCWTMIGGLLAILMSSVGPCFYSEFVAGDNEYSALMQTLHGQRDWLSAHFDYFAIWALDIQSALWNLHASNVTAMGSGISAMPSMHVSTAVLMALGMNSLDKRLGAVFWIYALLIQIGSVHLAWHYAIDGYLSAVLTWVIWYATRFFVGSDTESAS